MTPTEHLKSKQRAALIVVLTLGLAAVPIVHNAQTNLFEGCSFDQGRMHIVCRLFSFLFLTALCAIPTFVVYLVILIVTTIKLSMTK